MIDPENIPEDLIEKAAKGMRAFDLLCRFQHEPGVQLVHWINASEGEKNAWKGLAKVALIAISAEISISRKESPNVPDVPSVPNSSLG